MSSGSWDDLAARMGSGLVLVVVGVAAIWFGAFWFHLLIAVACGLMAWELVRMLTPDQPNLALTMGAMSGVALMIAGYSPPGVALPLILAPTIIGFGQLEHRRATFMSYTVLMLLAGFGMVMLRDDFGFTWMLWLIVVVVVTDVAGYFAGRLIGGPKFWPKVSPKKTWSGTVAGWVGAAVVGAIFAVQTGAGMGLIGISIAISMASQMGDIAESAIKRSCNIKDSSNLIPGHGGLLDRFDGMLGASLLILIVGQVIAFPPVG